jgi:putative oxidoreductase
VRGAIRYDMAAITTSRHRNGVTRGKGVHVGLWVAQALLAALFLMAGLMKATTPIPELVLKLPWAADVPVALVRLIGLAEIFGAVGVVLPSASRIRPRLTPLAAVGLAVVMVLALAFHGSRGELAQAAPINLTLGLLAAFVAWGRTFKSPIAPR